MQPHEAAFESVAAEFRPLPRVGPLEAVRRHWLLALLPIVVIVPIVAFVVHNQPPTYSAEARLMVGRLNLSAPGAIQGYAQAAQDLAATYPLVIDANGVVAPLEREFHLTYNQVVSHISASEVPSSSIVRVTATAKSRHLAVSLANAASGSMVTYLVTQNRDDPDIAHLYNTMQSAQLAYQKAAAALPSPTNGPPQASTPAQQKALANAATAKNVLEAAVHNYDSTSQVATVSSILQPIMSATQASSNHRATLELAVLISCILALMIGVTAATLRANYLVRRALTLPPWEPPA